MFCCYAPIVLRKEFLVLDTWIAPNRLSFVRTIASLLADVIKVGYGINEGHHAAKKENQTSDSAVG